MHGYFSHAEGWQFALKAVPLPGPGLCAAIANISAAVPAKKSGD